MKKAILSLLLLCAGSFGLWAQSTVTGQIRDKEGALPGVSVFVAESNIGTVTEPNGNFSLSLPDGTHRIMISFVGYKKMDTLVRVPDGQVVNLGQITIESQAMLQSVEITGMYSSGERRAIEMRRSASAIMEVMSSDAIGKLPDINAAEAVQRIPGVSIDRDQGEGRYVTVRGTPSQWSSTTINGDRMPAAKTSGDLLGNRTVPMDLLPTEFIDYVQVVKALTPEYEGDAIGGTINFIPRTSPEERTLRVTGALPYSLRASDKLGYQGTVLYGDRVLNDKLGFMVLGNVNRRTYGTDNYEVVYGNALHNVNTLDVRSYEGIRTNTGINVAMDYRVRPNTELYARGYYTELLDNERNRKTMHYFNKDVDNAVLRWNIVDYWFKNYGGEAGLKSKLSEKLNMQGRVALYKSWAGYKGPSSVDKNMRGYYYGNWVQTVKYGNMVNIDGTDYKFLKGDGPAGYQGDDPDNVQPHFDPSTPYNPDNYYLDKFVTSIRNINETDKVAALDFQYKPTNDLLIKFGGKYRHKYSTYDYRYVTWTYDKDAPKAYLPMWQRENFPSGNWFPELGNAYDNLKFSYPTEASIIDPMRNPDIARYLTYKIQDKTNSSYATGNYDATEQVGAAYVMGEWDINNELALIGGARFEYTSVTSNSFTYNDVTKEVSPVTGTKSVPAFLPMAHLIYRPTSKLDFRAAITRTFARPAFNELSPNTRVNPDKETVVMGNNDLRPTFSWNFDVLGSYYINNTSYLSGGLFYKDITDVIYSKSHDEMRTVDGTPALYKVSQPVNAESAFLYGVELGYSHKFTFLPGFLDGLGLNLNYTYTRSETTLEDRAGEKVGLMNQSPNIFNATLFYEKAGFAMRLAANYREAFLVELRENAGADRYQDKDFHLDLNLSYTFPKRITLFVDINNLNNQPLRYYHGVPSRPEQVEYYSIRGRIGLSWNL